MNAYFYFSVIYYSYGVRSNVLDVLANTPKYVTKNLASSVSNTEKPSKVSKVNWITMIC